MVSEKRQQVNKRQYRPQQRPQQRAKMRADREPVQAGGRGEATPEKQVAPGCSKQESWLTLGNTEHPAGRETGRSWTPRGPDGTAAARTPARRASCAAAGARQLRSPPLPASSATHYAGGGSACGLGPQGAKAGASQRPVSTGSGLAVDCHLPDPPPGAQSRLPRRAPAPPPHVLAAPPVLPGRPAGPAPTSHAAAAKCRRRPAGECGPGGRLRPAAVAQGLAGP